MKSVHFQKITHVAACMAASLLLPLSVMAQTWPARPISLVSPYPPGGTNDVVGRLIAEKVAADLGATIVVQNKPGAAGIVGSRTVAAAAPDGYTLLTANNGSHVVQPVIAKTPPYDALKDFTPIASVVAAYVVIGIPANLPPRTLREFVDYAKSQPGKLSYGSAGNGSSGNFSGEFFKMVTGVDIVHVPGRGSGQALTDMIGGSTHLMLDPVVLQQVGSGRVRALAVSSPRRLPNQPDIPTVAEAGFPELELAGWFGWFGPAGLPRDITDRLAASMQKALNDPAVVQRLLAAGVVPNFKGPAAFEKQIREDTALYADVRKRANIAQVE